MQARAVNIAELSRLAHCRKTKILSLINKNVLIAEKRGRSLYFDDAYAKRVAPILAVQNMMACSLGWDKYKLKLIS